MKQIKKRKLNNKGLSLVEILVTVVIVALVSAPIVDSFLHAIHVNGEARLIQNATSVAQDTAELFEVFSVDALFDTYGGSKEGNIYTFEKIPMTGADGEEFEVDVKLDPTTYYNGMDKENNKRVQINGIDTPKLSGLYNSDCIMLYKQYAGSDETLKTLFAEKKDQMEGDDYENIDTPEVRSKITKSTVVNIRCVYDESSDVFTYNIKIEIVYEYAGNLKVTVDKKLEKTYKSNEIHRIYMLCPIFDRYTMNMKHGVYESTDDIFINYYYDGGSSSVEPKLHFYIAEQDMTNVYDSNIKQRISPEKLQINCVEKDGVNNGYVTYDKYIEEPMDLLGVYTNIGEDYGLGEYTLTYGDNDEFNTGVALYEMEVIVRLKGEKDIVTTFNTAK